MQPELYVLDWCQALCLRERGSGLGLAGHYFLNIFLNAVWCTCDVHATHGRVMSDICTSVKGTCLISPLPDAGVVKKRRKP